MKNRRDNHRRKASSGAGSSRRDFSVQTNERVRDTSAYRLGGIADPFKLAETADRPVLVTSLSSLRVAKQSDNFYISLKGMYYSDSKFGFIEDSGYNLSGQSKPIPSIGIFGPPGSGKSMVNQALSLSAGLQALHLDKHGKKENGHWVPDYLPSLDGNIFDTSWTKIRFNPDGVIVFVLPSYDLFRSANACKAKEVGVNDSHYALFSKLANMTFINYVGYIRGWFHEVLKISKGRVIVVPNFLSRPVNNGWHPGSVKGGNNG